MGMIEDVQAQLDAAEKAASQPKTDPPPQSPETPEVPSDAGTPSTPAPTDAATAAAAATQQAAAAETETGTETKIPPGWDKALQAQQQETASLGRKLDALLAQVTEQGGKATQEQVTAAVAMKDRLAELDTLLAGDFDGFEQTKPALKTVADELRETKKALAAINAKLEARENQDAQTTAQQQYLAAVEEFWSAKPPEARTAFAARSQELQGRGYTGERLAGALDAWWETYTPPTTKTDPPSTSATSTKTSTPPPPPVTAPSRPAGTTPGGARVVPANSGVRPSPSKKSAEDMIASGEWDPFGGRFPASR